MKWKKDKTTEKKQKEGMNSTPDYREWNLDDDPEEEIPGKRENCSEKRRVRKKQIRSSVLKNWKICWKSMETMWIRKQLSACMCRTESRKE